MSKCTVLFLSNFVAFSIVGVCQPLFAQGYNIAAGIHGNGSGNGNFPFTDFETGPAAGFFSGNGSGDGNGNTTAFASATLLDSLDSNTFYSGNSSVFSDRSGIFVPTAEGNSALIYADLISLKGGELPPPSIRVHFETAGSLNVNQVGDYGPHSFSQASLYVTGVPFPGGIDITSLVMLPESTGIVLASLKLRRDYDDFNQGLQSTKTTQSNWDELDLVGETFNGALSYDVIFNTAMDGYAFEIRSVLSALANDSTAATSASLRMVAVTNSDGRPLSSFDISFESGRTLEFEVIFGDTNGDGVVNLLDVQPFITLISNGTFQAEADINEDGAVNLLDVEPFIQLLATQ